MARGLNPSTLEPEHERIYQRVLHGEPAYKEPEVSNTAKKASAIVALLVSLGLGAYLLVYDPYNIIANYGMAVAVLVNTCIITVFHLVFSMFLAFACMVFGLLREAEG